MDYQNVSLLSIPCNDVLHTNVLPFLDVRDLFNLRSVCKACQIMVDSYFPICQSLNFTQCRRMNKHGFKILFKNCTRVKYFNLAKCDWITDCILMLLLSRNKQIVHINLSYCTQVGTKSMHIIMDCKELSTLILAGCVWLTPHLLSALTFYQENLKTVDLSRCVQLSKLCILKFVMKFSTLKYLSLAYIPSITDHTVITIANHCPELEFLNIDGYLASNQALNVLLQKCNQLESVKIDGQMAMTIDKANRPLKYKCIL